MPDVHPGKGCTIGTSVSDAKWTAQLSTRAIGHPLPVTACARGGLSGAVTKCWKEESRRATGTPAHTPAEIGRRLEHPSGA